MRVLVLDAGEHRVGQAGETGVEAPRRSLGTQVRPSSRVRGTPASRRTRLWCESVDLWSLPSSPSAPHGWQPPSAGTAGSRSRASSANAFMTAGEREAPHVRFGQAARPVHPHPAIIGILTAASPRQP